MNTKEILEEIKKLSLKEQAKIIKEVENYKQEILEELDAKPLVIEKEYIPYPVYPKYPWYEQPYKITWDISDL